MQREKDLGTYRSKWDVSDKSSGIDEYPTVEEQRVRLSEPEGIVDSRTRYCKSAEQSS